MPSARLPHLEGVGVEKGPADESLQNPAALPPYQLAPPGSQDDTTPYLSFIRHLNARFIIFTDGSATAGTLNGCAGLLVTEGDPANPTTLLTKQQRGAAITSSYDEE